MKEVSPEPDHPRTAELPRLEDVTADIRNHGSKLDEIHAILRQTALNYRNGHFQTFYSIRAVAQRFAIPPTTVSRIYRRLSSQGLLRMVWGSRTLLEPAASNRAKQGAMIGVPVDLRRLVTSMSYRQLILQTQREIWSHGATERCLFFETGEELVHICKERSCADLHQIIWLLPERSDKETALRLRDLGLHVVCIGYAPMAGLEHYLVLSATLTLKRIVRSKIGAGH